MSWSVSLVGKSDAVAKRAAEEFERIDKYLKEPEKSVAHLAGGIVAFTLAGQIPATAVKLQCSGSMSTTGATDQPDKITNTLNISVEPFWGYVE